MGLGVAAGLSLAAPFVGGGLAMCTFLGSLCLWVGLGVARQLKTQTRSLQQERLKTARSRITRYDTQEWSSEEHQERRLYKLTEKGNGKEGLNKRVRNRESNDCKLTKRGDG